MRDFIQLPDTVHDYVTYAGTIANTGAETIDGDFDTYWGGSCTKDGTTYLKSLHTFSAAKHIKKFVIKTLVEVHTQSGSSSDTGYSQSYIYYKQSGAWNLLSASLSSVSCSGDCDQAQTLTKTLDVDLQNVTDVYAYAYGENRHDSGGGGGSNQIKIYEIQAFGDSKDWAGVV